MTSPTRAELLRLLAEVSELDSDVRFGQLIANLSYLAVEPKAGVIWEVEDDQLVAAVRMHLANLADRTARVA